MQIIFDGPNRAGKTTLITKILDDGILNIHKTWKGNAPDKTEHGEINAINMLQQMTSWANEDKALSSGGGFNIILDRFYYPTETIYRPIMDPGANSMLINNQQAYINWLRYLNVFYVFVIADNADLIARHKEHKEHWHVKDEQLIPRIADAYRNLMLNFQLPHVIVNTSLSDIDQAVDQIWRAVTYHYDERTHGHELLIKPGVVYERGSK